MNDIQLYARLKDLGMPANQAWPLTAQIRDSLHPIAATAAQKVLKAAAAGVNGLGTVTSSQEIQAGSAATGAAVGAAYGSVVPGIGTAVGAVVGLVASMLVHTGQGALRLQQANAIAQGLSTIPSAYVGRLIPWNGTATAPGLLQFISALMTGGLYMSWDPSVESSPSVNGNWSTCFQNAVIAVTKAIIANAVGASVSVPIVISGVSGSPTKTFTFTNPGINVGPDAVAASIIMGPQGLMYWIIISIGETAAHASANATNSAAQKVYALMVDHATADALPASLSTTLANAPITQVPAPVVAAANTLAASTVASGTVPTLQTTTTAGAAPTVANVSTPSSLNSGQTAGTSAATDPTTAVLPATTALTQQQDTTAALLQQLIAAQGANLTSPTASQLLADVAANGVAQTPEGPSSMPSWLLPVGIAAAIGVVALVLLKK